MDINNTNFYQSITRLFEEEKKKYDKSKEFLRYHQYIIKEYVINPKRDVRGILAYWDPGTGKTYLVVSIAEYIRQFYPDKKIVILSAKSLAGNFRGSLETFIRSEALVNADKKKGADEISQAEIDKIISDRYKFVSSNASNMIQQLQNIRSVDKTRSEAEKKTEQIEERLGLLVSENKKSGFLEDSLLIVDEAHNIFNSITNGSKNAVAFYDMVMNTKNIKIVFLSGTPIINSPFEIAPCLNMLFGKSFFPEIEEDFQEWFVDGEKFDVKNKQKFTNYIAGLVSYYGNKKSEESFTQSGKITKRENFPDELPLKIINVPMSNYQFGLYEQARVDEQKESIGSGSGSAPQTRFGVGGKQKSSTYRVKSRQMSNFAFPKNIRDQALAQLISVRKLASSTSLENQKKAQDIKKKLKSRMVGQLTSEQLTIHKNDKKGKQENKKGLNEYSPKMVSIINNVNKNMASGKSLGIVYSTFVTGEGLSIFAKALDVTGGWELYKLPSKKERKKKGGATKQVPFDDIPDIYVSDMWGMGKRGGKTKVASAKTKVASAKTKVASAKTKVASAKTKVASAKTKVASAKNQGRFRKNQRSRQQKSQRKKRPLPQKSQRKSQRKKRPLQQKPLRKKNMRLCQVPFQKKIAMK